MSFEKYSYFFKNKDQHKCQFDTELPQKSIKADILYPILFSIE